jgi:hypothetical protein
MNTGKENTLYVNKAVVQYLRRRLEYAGWRTADLVCAFHAGEPVCITLHHPSV